MLILKSCNADTILEDKLLECLMENRRHKEHTLTVPPDMEAL